MSVQQKSAVYSNAGILGAQPTFRDTRVTFETLLDHIEDGGGEKGFEEFLQGFPPSAENKPQLRWLKQ